MFDKNGTRPKSIHIGIVTDAILAAGNVDVNDNGENYAKGLQRQSNQRVSNMSGMMLRGNSAGSRERKVTGAGNEGGARRDKE